MCRQSARTKQQHRLATSVPSGFTPNLAAHIRCLPELTLDQQAAVLHPPALCELHTDKSPCQLADTVHEAPCLLKLLTSGDWAALSACNRQLRYSIRCRTQAIGAHSRSSVHQIPSHNWPQLALVVLQDKHLKNPVQLRNSHQMSVLTALDLSHAYDRQRCTAFIVAAKSGHNQPMAHGASTKSSTIAKASPQQMQLTALDSSSHFAIAMSYMPKVDSQMADDMVIWQRFAGRDYTAEVMSISWPSLVDVGSSCLTTAGITAMAGAMASLPSLQIVCMDDSDLRVDAQTINLQQGWSQLKQLSLRNTHLSIVALNMLVDAPWPGLTDLLLSSNELGATHMQALVSAKMPLLTYLWLDDNKLDRAAAAHLAEAEWPKLQLLVLDDNCLDDVAVRHLSRGKWPELYHLEVNGNKFTNVTSFSSDRWPGLGVLYLDRQVLSVASFIALDLSCDALYELAQLVGASNKTVSVSKRERLSSEERVATSG